MQHICVTGAAIPPAEALTDDARAAASTLTTSSELHQRDVTWDCGCAIPVPIRFVVMIHDCAQAMCKLGLQNSRLSMALVVIGSSPRVTHGAYVGSQRRLVLSCPLLATNPPTHFEIQSRGYDSAQSSRASSSKGSKAPRLAATQVA
ncbi:hypothetical protein IE81DRAFT_259003 [Ceraceosorus guamensis]|uniref:Uncharacterized protein n=1 Tax=Ceraceosorus guamensis TaxID=1522189 RepID=A0A316VQ75_9BASI|nr:hypothetical protein IE81DRAFT_259003 [Ceraceosorus guamensis]PWN39746.1 hypothetical protein IE81DRAFT_259003 [Ceraceosorus guamensis]